MTDTLTWDTLTDLLTDTVPGDWRYGALCAQTDPDIFFPPQGGKTRPAKQICMACDVRTQCREWALNNALEFGVFGGLSARQRLRIRNAEPGQSVPQASNAEKRATAVMGLYAQGQSAKDIAPQVGMHVDTVRAIIRRHRSTVHHAA
jgi:WhiB family redox-sensing transcriptional regulator